jgi:arabinose-5-phosphate isomerase
VRACMTAHPRTLPADALVRDAVRLVRELRVDELPVVDADGRPLGLLDVQDLVAMKVVRD